MSVFELGHSITEARLEAAEASGESLNEVRGDAILLGVAKSRAFMADESLQLGK
jgi:hypothetical protein